MNNKPPVLPPSPLNLLDEQHFGQPETTLLITRRMEDISGIVSVLRDGAQTLESMELRLSRFYSGTILLGPLQCDSKFNVQTFWVGRKLKKKKKNESHGNVIPELQTYLSFLSYIPMWFCSAEFWIIMYIYAVDMILPHKRVVLKHQRKYRQKYDEQNFQ